jgi:hypothetical protein
MANHQTENGAANFSDEELIAAFRTHLQWSFCLFTVIFFVFFLILVIFHLQMIILILAFFEPSNLITSTNSFIEKYDSATLLTVLIIGITGIYLYIRFFSNIQENYFEGEMGRYFQFYETFYSLLFDISILGILFLYLLIVKDAIWEFFSAFL